uniref:NUC domain-containing protein n=1 Tax=Syphacia muris TaxID=451379 RepID=A0A0N5AA63_9BILA
MNITPNIQQIFDCGTHSKFMIPSFPSKTFPNHYSIATGLYPTWHGIVDNSFMDPNMSQAVFTQGTTSEGWFLGEPIWRTVQRFGLKSAVFFWPGSESPDKLPDYYKKYDKSVPYSARADQIVEWLKMDEEDRPTLLQLYMEEPDGGGHTGGPDSQEVRSGMIMMDGITKYLTDRLIEEGLMGCINIIILSDHGMQQLDMSRAVIMNHQLPADFDGFVFSGVIGHVAVNDKSIDLDELVDSMRCKAGKDYLVYKTPLTPTRFHYGSSKRNGDLVIQGRAGVFVMKDEEEFERRKYNKGNHGFDNRLRSMRAIFAAFGPDVVENREIPEFQNIELYNLFCDLLRIQPSPNNGTRGQLYAVMKNPPKYTNSLEVPSEQCLANVTITYRKAFFQDTSRMVGSCSYDTASIQFNTGVDVCVISLCDAVIHYNSKFGKVEMIETTLSADDWNEKESGCSADISDLRYSCNVTDQSRISLFLNKDVYKTLEVAKVPVTEGFITEIWNPFLAKVEKYVKFYHKISLYAGVAYDSNADSLRDVRPENLNKPTHIYVTLLRCLDTSYDRHNCTTPETLSFILPIIDSDFNCLLKDEFFFENTARVRDVELLSSAEFFRNRNIWSTEQSIYLRTQLPQNLWP